MRMRLHSLHNFRPNCAHIALKEDFFGTSGSVFLANYETLGCIILAQTGPKLPLHQKGTFRVN